MTSLAEEQVEELAPERYIRMAKEQAENGKTADALDNYYIARQILSARIQREPYFGDLTIMKWVIRDIYKLMDLDPAFIGLYDLYEILRAPAIVHFFYNGERHEVEAIPNGEGHAIRFDDSWYWTIDDFFQKAELHGRLLTSLYEEVYGFEIESHLKRSTTIKERRAER